MVVGSFFVVYYGGSYKVFGGRRRKPGIVIRARGRIVRSNIPVPGTGESHSVHLLFFIICILMRGVLGGVFLGLLYAVRVNVYRPYRLERHRIEWWWTVGPIIIVGVVALPTLVTLYWGEGGVIPVALVMAVGHQ